MTDTGSTRDYVPLHMIGAGELRMTCEACPTQIEGEYRGQKVYFRHRHGRWTIQWGTEIISAGTFSIGPADGIMPPAIAMLLITSEIDLHQPPQRGGGPADPDDYHRS